MKKRIQENIDGIEVIKMVDLEDENYMLGRGPWEDTEEEEIIEKIRKLISDLDIDGETAEYILGESLSEQVAKQYILTSDIDNIEEFLSQRPSFNRDKKEKRFIIISNFIDMFVHEEEEREPYYEYLDEYLNSEIWKELEGETNLENIVGSLKNE